MMCTIAASADPLGNAVSIVRDDNGLPTRITDSIARATNLDYDSAGNPIEVTLTRRIVGLAPHG